MTTKRTHSVSLKVVDEAVKRLVPEETNCFQADKIFSELLALLRSLKYKNIDSDCMHYHLINDILYDQRKFQNSCNHTTGKETVAAFKLLKEKFELRVVTIGILLKRIQLLCPFNFYHIGRPKSENTS